MPKYASQQPEFKRFYAMLNEWIAANANNKDPSTKEMRDSFVQAVLNFEADQVALPKEQQMRFDGE